MHAIGVNDAMLPSTPPMRTSRDSWTRWLRPRSAIWDGITKLRNRLAAPIPVNHGMVVTRFPKPEAWVNAKADEKRIAEYMENSFKPTLRSLIELHRDRGETAILLTQPANPQAVRRENGSVLVSSPAMAQWAVGLSAIDAAMKAVCGERPDNCRFIDLSGRLPLEPADFYDLVHYTPRGAARIGKFLAGELSFIRSPAGSAAARLR
jgi:hypothetical protein